MSAKDENDRFKDGTLPADPADDSKIVSDDVPRVLTVRDLLEGSIKRATQRRARGICTTGHYQLDHITGGLRPGFVWVIGAGTSWGKSSLLVMLTDENIKKGKKVLIVSAEDPESLYADRLMARRSRVSADAIRKREIDGAQLDKMNDEARKAEDLPVFLDARGRSVEWLAPRIKQLIVKYGIDVVAYDYLQAFDNQERQQDRRNQISYIARVLTDVAKTAIPGGVAGILLSQITEDGKKAHPDKHSIRESRDVSNAGEVVALGFTPEKPIVKSEGGEVLVRAGERCLFVDKNKDGPRGALIALPWDEECACFETVEDPETARISRIVDEAGDFGDFNDGRY